MREKQYCLKRLLLDFFLSQAVLNVAVSPLCYGRKDFSKQLSNAICYVPYPPGNTYQISKWPLSLNNKNTSLIFCVGVGSWTMTPWQLISKGSCRKSSMSALGEKDVLLTGSAP